MSGVFLTLNAGSSSIKFAVFDGDSHSDAPLISGKIAGIGTAPVFAAKDAQGDPMDTDAFGALDPAVEHETLIALLLPWLALHTEDRPLLAVGHRVVHGGRFYSAPVRVTPEVIAQLETLVSLAPLHQPHNLAALRAVARWRPDTPQIACFDTSFHRTQDRLAQLFALPRALSDEGVTRYGFHGLSYDYIASTLPRHLGQAAEGRVIVAHLGNGASMCAMKNRASVATSMGFTALDGLMMGRRCGSLDPGVVLYLMQAKGMDAAAIETLLYQKSGLFGVSGMTNDMHILENSDDAHAREAVDLFCYRAASTLAGLVPAIGGLDALVFTAGIGENSATVRARICDQLAWLGITLDPQANGAHEVVISAQDAPVKVLVIPTNEERVVVNACHAILSGASSATDA
jgi:acetate kinase